MKTRADVAARVELLAAAFRASARAKRIGPRVRIVATRIHVVDVLECGHEVPSRAGPERRVCPHCLLEKTG